MFHLLTLTPVQYNLSNFSAIHGEKALFSRNRLYLAGQKLKFKDSILDHLNLGEKLSCDMVSIEEQFLSLVCSQRLC